jgi:hypothetical protein
MSHVPIAKGLYLFLIHRAQSTRRFGLLNKDQSSHDIARWWPSVLATSRYSHFPLTHRRRLICLVSRRFSSSRTFLAPHSMQVQLHVVVRCLNWRMRERPHAVDMSKPRLVEDYIAGHNVRMRSECVGPHPRAQSNPLPSNIPRGSHRHLQGASRAEKSWDAMSSSPLLI